MANIIKKRPCAVCRRWFRPHPKVKNRAVTCCDPQCQQEWHRRQCQKWNRRNKTYFRSNYLQKKLEHATELEPFGERELPQATLRQPSNIDSPPKSTLEPTSNIFESHLIIIIDYVIHVHFRRFQKLIIPYTYEQIQAKLSPKIGQDFIKCIV